ncbi:myo-inositol 2-dehydrogenase [Photobacterium aphoticum]|uniref:Myo-inositol 2-dehydrogenase n=1 Tax=Photobacterium aphoticum TaxID=754436 RepID=A0A090QRY2_9GAMM|nr:myo-inositol 2-dehydrogenase [Photobacterium aphoticum]
MQGRPVQILERGHGYLHNDNELVSADHIGAGHAEGLFESWANIYTQFAKAMDAKMRGDEAAYGELWCPDITDGIEGVRLIEKCVESADAGAIWVEYK